MIRQTSAEPVAQSIAETRIQAIEGTVPAVAAANEQLRQRVRLFLMGSNLPGLRHLEVEVHGDTVILSGSVCTFYEKQLAVRLSRRVAGVIHVVDSIEAGATCHGQNTVTRPLTGQLTTRETHAEGPILPAVAELPFRNDGIGEKLSQAAVAPRWQ